MTEPSQIGIAALFASVYGDVNLVYRRDIVQLVVVANPGAWTVTVSAELTDNSFEVATGFDATKALSAVLAQIAARRGPPPMPENLSGFGVQLLREREGLELTLHRDTAGLLTIGFGHQLTRSELTSGKLSHDYPAGLASIKWGNGLTSRQSDDLLLYDLGFSGAPSPAAIIRTHVRVPLSVCQFDALCSLVFDIGAGAFLGSRLLQLLNDAQYDAVAGQFRRWVYIAGRKRRELIARRNSEADQWLGVGVTPQHSEEF